jgi:mannosyltransferase OCH1-like enzyme
MLQTVQALSQTSIEIKEVDTSVFDGDKTIESLFLESVSEKKYGRASDILRYVLLKKGGIYSDIDNAYYHNLERLRTYSFFAGIEPMSCLVGNAVMGSSKDNPVILDLLKRVKTNLASDGGAAHYIKDIKDNGFGTIVKTGPLALSLSLYAAGEKEGYRNIILPPYLIYPSVKEGVYPQKDISKKINDVGKYSFGKHDWDSTWIPINQEKFGSVG